MHARGLYRRQVMSVETRLHYVRRRRGLNRLCKQFLLILADCGQQKNLFGAVE